MQQVYFQAPCHWHSLDCVLKTCGMAWTSYCIVFVPAEGVPRTRRRSKAACSYLKFNTKKLKEPGITQSPGQASSLP